MEDDSSRHGECPSPISGNNGGGEEIGDEVTQHLHFDVKEEDRDMVKNSTEKQQPLQALDTEAQETEECSSDTHLYRVSRFCCQRLLGVVDEFVERFTSAPLEEALFYRQEQEGVEQTAEVGERKEPSSHLLKRLTERDKPLGETMAHFLARLRDVKQEIRDILKDLSDREESGGPAHPLSSSQVDGVAEGREGQQIGNRRSIRSKMRLLDTLYFMCETSNANLLQMSRVSLGDCRDPGSTLRLCPLDCSMLVGALTPLGIIEEVNLSHCCIGPEGLQQLSSILHRCKSLRLSWNNLGDSGVKILCSSLRESLCEIQELWVDNNGLTGVGTKNLAYAIAKNQSVLLLSLSYNRVEEATMKLLCDALRRRSCTIQHLQLSGTGITSAYCRQLAWALSTNRSLTVLDLDNNHLGDSGVSLLCGALMKPDCKIQNLRLSSNRLTALCTLELTRVLSTNRSLRRLSVSYNRLGTPGLRRLSAALKAPACPLQKLELDDNGLRDACAEELAISLSRNRWLKGLYLNRNCFTDQSIPAFQQLAESCISLKYIWLCRNQFSAEGQSKLQSLEESAHRVTIFV